MKVYEGQWQNNVTSALCSVVLKTHVQIMFMTTALKAFFKFSHGTEDEQKG